MVETRAKELIPSEAFEELKVIVGQDYATMDPIICQAYTARGYAREQMGFLGYSTRPACVVIPATTSEVARIVKLCNRYGLPYTPASSMWVIQACPRFRDDFVLIDLKRMDKMRLCRGTCIPSSRAAAHRQP